MLYGIGFLVLLFLFRNPILRSVGRFLVAEDTLRPTEACFVLGGNSYERGLKAVHIAELYPQQFFVATGGNLPLQIQALDTVMYEAELTKYFMARRGVASENIQTLTGSTSTMEESNEILNYCKQYNLKEIAIISNTFHLRRVKWVFNSKFKKEGISVYFFGAPTSTFTADTWWKDEEGLITCNNEYMKLLYYLVKY